MADMSVWQLSALGALVFFAGVVDALAGGGGMITLPAYLSMGLPPALLLGTNKLASSIGTVASAARYHHHLRFSIRKFLPVLACTLFGSALGAGLALCLDPGFIRYILLASLPVVAYSVLSRHDFGRHDRSHELPAGELRRRSCLLGAGIGSYDGFFGPATGTFFALALARWCRHDLLQATGRAKVMNLASNLAALAVFLWSGRLDIRLGLTMAGASLAGHWLGAHLGLRKGTDVIKPVVALVCALLFLKILRDTLRP
ncbi:MAG: TSUP family transporter [Elusimicrobiota bacterium]|jgi:hypothetical protein